MGIGTAALLLVLFYAKYFNYIAGLLNEAGADLQYTAMWNLLGISFITFSAISYLADIYREDGKGRRIS